MDEAYRWCGLVESLEQRKLVLMRSLVWPDSPPDDPHYVHSWRKLRQVTGLHSDTLKMRWGRGIDAITSRLNRPSFCVAAGRFGAAHVMGRLRPSVAIATMWL